MPILIGQTRVVGLDYQSSLAHNRDLVLNATGESDSVSAERGNGAREFRGRGRDRETNAAW